MKGDKPRLVRPERARGKLQELQIETRMVTNREEQEAWGTMSPQDRTEETEKRILEINRRNKTLRVGKSKIPGLREGKAWGVMATRDVTNNGAIIATYGGEKLTKEVWENRYPADDADYVFHTDVDTYIDAADPRKSTIARWLNHGRGEAENVEAVYIQGTSSRVVAFKAKRNIKKGTSSSLKQ